MAAHPKKPYVTPQEYLERERAAEIRSEYYDGEIVAMSGASWEHNLITSNLGRLLGNQLEKRPCAVVTQDLRVRVAECNQYYYPDVVVVCGTPKFEDVRSDALVNPTLIIEVLSESTWRIDHGKKLDCYRTLASLSTYLLVDQYEPRLETYTRQFDGSWRYQSVNGLDAVLTVEPFDVVLRLADVYARIEFAPRKAEEGVEAAE